MYVYVRMYSNRQFETDDSFQFTFVQVHTPSWGTGKKETKIKAGHSHPETFKRMKRNVVTINNKDHFCAARALVTAKANVDGHPQWKKFKEGRSLQYEHALLLHYEGDIPFGPCGYEELQKVALAPSLDVTKARSLVHPRKNS